MGNIAKNRNNPRVLIINTPYRNKKCNKKVIIPQSLIFYVLAKSWLVKASSSSSTHMMKRNKNYTHLMIYMRRLIVIESYIFINYQRREHSILRDNMMGFYFSSICWILGMLSIIF